MNKGTRTEDEEQGNKNKGRETRERDQKTDNERTSRQRTCCKYQKAHEIIIEAAEGVVLEELQITSLTYRDEGDLTYRLIKYFFLVCLKDTCIY